MVKIRELFSGLGNFTDEHKRELKISSFMFHRRK